MHHIFVLMGKSSSGKDSIYRELMKDPALALKSVTIYTTRPMRDGEKEGREYFFRTIPEFEQARAEGKVIEWRCYPSFYGPWYYYTADDGQIDPAAADYLLPGTIESFVSIRSFYGADTVLPIYVEVEDGERLIRAIRREQTQENPKYEEMCRRFLADCADFSEEKIREAGIGKRFVNDALPDCIARIREWILEAGPKGEADAGMETV